MDNDDDDDDDTTLYMHITKYILAPPHNEKERQ